MIQVIEKPQTNKALSADEVIAANLAMVADGLAMLRQFFQPDSEDGSIAVELESCRKNQKTGIVKTTFSLLFKF